MIVRIFLMFVAVLFVNVFTLGMFKAQAEMAVYDGNNEYLGVLAGTPSSFIPVFIPSISIILSIDTANGHVWPGDKWFESDDCTGPAYVESRFMFRLYGFNGEYYTGENVVPVLRRIESRDSGGYCSSGYECDPCGSPLYTVPVRKISRSDIPKLPVALPLRLKYRYNENDCISVGADLSMPIPCVEYNGAQYDFTLNLFNNPYDPSGLYWKMDKSTLVVK